MGRFFARFNLRVSQHVRLRVMAFITIADTGIISYISTKNLAERWGFGSLSWLYPLCLDAVAAVGMDLWMSGSPAKRAAAWLSLFAVGLSLAANVADWLYIGPGAAVLGAVPPLMLAALLLTMHYHAARTEQVKQRSRRRRRPAPSSPPRRRGPKPRVSDDEVIAAIREHEEAGPVTRRFVMDEFRMGTPRAIRLIDAARNGAQLDLAAIQNGSR